ncbi:protein disks lost [Teleopsis dalmanni]|uniref:protein disks lost n=1 Tax=Teleopsis dalmanni TaxID=139649 RepID=UPI0018CD9297|nr:protein disks lost [Teleopsis dalmanni]
MSAAEGKLKALLSFKLELEPSMATASHTNTNDMFTKFFLEQFNTTTNSDCTLKDFATYFINAIHQRIESHFQHKNDMDLSNYQTPKRKPKTDQHSVTPKCLLFNQNQSTPLANRKGTSAKRIQYDATPSSPQLSLNSTAQDQSFVKSIHTSTPVRYGTPQTPQSQLKRSNNSLTTSEKRNHNSSSSLCLGDFLTINTSSNSRQRKKQQHSSQHNTTETPNTKPKKRVVPTTILSRNSSGQTGTPFGITNSSFSDENNMLKMRVLEVDDRSKCSILEARRSLKLGSNIPNELRASEIDEIKCQSAGDLNFYSCVETKLKDVTEIDEVSINAEVLSPIHLEKVTDRGLLERLGVIYSLLIELNYVTNVLSEITLLLNLLNSNESAEATIDAHIQKLEIKDDTLNLEILRNFTNSIYFALYVLNMQRPILGLLDIKSLGVILSTERIISLADDLQLYLSNVYAEKQHLDAIKAAELTTSVNADKSFKLVHYQANKDSRQNFSSNDDFGAFKSQRDLFCKILKIWEENHLKPTWNLSTGISHSVHEIFRLSESVVNIMHFAKLFVDQLLKTSTDSTTPEEVGLDKNLDKYSKLTQRLTAPSNFSAEYQFPRHQAFFRDFIIESRSIPFTEQLKITLFSELTSLNNSTFEHINLKDLDNDIDADTSTDHNTPNEYVVHPDVLASMLTLAKFLGFVTALPYSAQPTCLSTNIEKKQIMLRSLFQPDFDVCRILRNAINSGKLLITIPWLVQYMAMLDNITLQLDNNVAVAKEMFNLYMQLGNKNCGLRATASFILRCCLGWLFETKSIIGDQLHQYKIRNPWNVPCNPHPYAKLKEINLLISNDLITLLPSDQQAFYISSVDNIDDSRFTIVLQRQQLSQSTVKSSAMEPYETTKLELSPMLESILTVACPFLAEFRLSIMPAKFTMAKYVSRTGRYRHITTRIAEITTQNAVMMQNKTSTIQEHNTNNYQNKLVEAFLHAQNSSMCRLIEFLTERTFKSTVKDAQYKILLPSKCNADKKVNEITSTDFETVSNYVRDIYLTAKKDAIKEWQAQVPKWLQQRIKDSLDSLLPIETRIIVKDTYAYIIRRGAGQKLRQWLVSNFLTANFYCDDLKDMTQKICKANERRKQDQKVSGNLNSELNLIDINPSVSDVIDKLQYLLHCSSLRLELMPKAETILKFLQQLPLVFKNILPLSFYIVIGSNIVRLLQNIITHKPDYLTADIINAACSIWLAQPMIDANRNSTQFSNKAGPGLQDSATDHNDLHTDLTKALREEIPSIFDGLITVPFVEALKSHYQYEKLKDLCIEMIYQQLITVDYLNVQILKIFKYDMNSKILNEISLMLAAVAQDTASNGKNTYNDYDNDNDLDKSQLFMEVLAEFSRDIDNF